MPETRPYIPTNIVVHLGLPDSNAQNVTVPFREYIYNVASSEIYPTWEESALRANILAIISYALNRILDTGIGVLAAMFVNLHDPVRPEVHPGPQLLREHRADHR